MNPTQALPIVPQNGDDLLSQYAWQLLQMRPAEHPVDDVLREMEAFSAQNNVPIIGPLEGAIIQVLMRLRTPAPQNVLDIGGAIGYSAIWLARGLAPQGRVVSIEMDAARAAMAREYVYRAGLAGQVEIQVGDVFEILPTIETAFDVILQDVIKHIYFGASSKLSLQLLDLCIERLAPGGMLLGDNVFCMGEVLHEDPATLPAQVIGIQAYNQQVAAHPLLESVTLPVRDGLWVSHKRG